MTYDISSALMNMLLLGTILGGTLIAVIFLVRRNSTSLMVEKSRDARKYLTNLIVIGKLKQKAEEENVDLDESKEELYELLTLLEGRKKSLDDQIEDDLLLESEK